ncbi:MAG: hypothetical protein GF315_13760 [candidate division Zixibacteria bacterium]|nr:hypothetical protein [candidate division Zixibacteria bacterium]
MLGSREVMRMDKCYDQKIGKMLHAYEMGILSEEEAEQFEMHLMDCQYCYSQLESFDDGARLLSGDQDIRRLLQKRSLEESDSKTRMQRIWNYLWPQTPLVFKPAVAYFIILVLAIPVITGILSKGGNSIRPLQSITLVANRSSLDNSFSITEESSGLINFELPEAETGSEYKVVIKNERGNEVYRDDHCRPKDEFGIGQLYIPLHKMRPGLYKLIVTSRDKESPANERIYNFTIQ